MNAFLPATFDERVERLALGVMPIDAERRTRPAFPLVGRIEGTHGTPVIARHPSCVHALLESAGFKGLTRVRFTDAARRYAPRRFEVMLTAGTPVIIRPGFYPGAAYDVTERSTAIRGQVLRGSPSMPMRWARVEARLVVSGAPHTGRRVGIAHGDDRGEFLLLIDVQAATFGPIVDPLPVEVTVFGPLPTPPIPSSPDLPSRDPLWDLPVERDVPQPPPDPVTAGVAPPTNYGATPTSTTIIDVRLTVQNSIGDIVFQ